MCGVKMSKKSTATEDTWTEASEKQWKELTRYKEVRKFTPGELMERFEI